MNDHEQRLAALEEWQEQVNQNIQSLHQLINTTDYITSVTPLVEGGQEVGYTITFLHSDPIVIYHGKKGDKGDKGDTGDKGEQGEQGDKGDTGADGHTPQIGLTQEADGNWYWTLDGQLMTDPQGNPIRANGEDGKDGQDGTDGEDGQDGQDGTDGQPGQDGQDGTPAPTPQISLGSSLTTGTIMTDNGTKQADAWYLSVDGGQTWYRISGEDGEDGDRGPTGPQGPTGQTGQTGATGQPGDSMFSQAPEKSDDGTHWTFYLKDGESFDVPAYQALTIGEGTGTLYIAYTGSTTIPLTYPDGTTANGYAALVAQITPEGANGTYTDIDTRADDASGWSVTADLQTQTVTVTPGEGQAMLRVSLVGNDGSELARTRIVEKKPFDVDEATKTYTVYTAKGLLAWANNSLLYNCTLAADIDMSGQTWPQIEDFNHTFDGAGHTISNLTVSYSVYSAGLIGELSGGTVKNLLLAKATANLPNRVEIGGIIGSMQGGEIIACAISGCNVVGSFNVGGIVGWVGAGSVTACYAASCTTSSYDGNGNGYIVGSVDDGNVTACYYDGEGNGMAPVTYEDGATTAVTDDVTWQAAAEAMNKQLADNNYIWEENTNEVTKDDFPLVLVPNPDVQ